MPEEAESGKPDPAEQEKAAENAAPEGTEGVGEPARSEEDAAQAAGDSADKPDIPPSIEKAAEEATAEELDWPPDVELTKDDKSTAMLAWLLATITWWLGPLIIYLLKKEGSKFIAFHGLQALFFGIASTIAMIVAGVTVACWIGIVLAPAVWIAHIVISIIWCLKANKGEWAELPIIADWVKQNV